MSTIESLFWMILLGGVASFGMLVLGLIELLILAGVGLYEDLVASRRAPQSQTSKEV